ncbi:Sigma-70 factor, region 1.2 [Streptoalloteichus tenebrarius]|uniref:Sigma-70 factor, region 1.2 n=1 Tax=Streptoalloteichus tenebrarius (strain ATCC 17920 / DSM 40477 / JCM 4838 / CBS 697.72 / NBRC 16177 / NCIMB 11028 / NRRL B-12390 / A12253. 1 / ISP 5477) TaxID=1933 RepID=A0ABT1HMV3_STRSD|nr:Sigma-70 factor, region 1.2 [Streptoalloteichus tenebrarius]
MTVPHTAFDPDYPAAEVDLDAQGPAADLVRVYLNGIGRTKLLTAEEEVELAKRIEAGVFAQHMLETARRLPPKRQAELEELVRDGRVVGSRRTTCWRPTSGSWSASPSATPAAACPCWT